jgi:hypothetical protein
MYVHNARPITKPGSPWYWVEGGMWILACVSLGILFMWMGTNPFNVGAIFIGFLFWLCGALFYVGWYFDEKAYRERVGKEDRKFLPQTHKTQKDKMTLSEIIQECEKAENKKRYIARRNAKRNPAPEAETTTFEPIRSEELIE